MIVAPPSLQPNGDLIKPSGDVIRPNGDIFKADGQILRVGQPLRPTPVAYDPADPRPRWTTPRQGTPRRRRLHYPLAKLALSDLFTKNLGPVINYVETSCKLKIAFFIFA